MTTVTRLSLLVLVGLLHSAGHILAAENADLELFRKQLEIGAGSGDSRALFEQALASQNDDLLGICGKYGGCRVWMLEFLRTSPDRAANDRLSLVLLKTDEAWQDRVAEFKPSYRDLVIISVKKGLEGRLSAAELETFDLQKKSERPRLAARIEAVLAAESRRLTSAGAPSFRPQPAVATGAIKGPETEPVAPIEESAGLLGWGAGVLLFLAVLAIATVIRLRR